MGTVVYVPAQTGRRRPWLRAKRVLDACAAALLLLLLFPLLVVLAVAIVVDSPGSPLFRQKRYGRNGTPFVVLKFRTMHNGASAELHRRYIERAARGESNGDSGLKKLTVDPRVTRLGRLLRRTSLDELPQLVNVLRGQMSLVGPRPALEYELDYYEPEHFDRFDVRPGLTGLWQVSGRSELDFRSMLDLDVEYARSCSLRTDASILLRTPRAVISKRAA